MFNLYKHIEELGKAHGYQTMQELCKAADVWVSAMSNLNNGRAKNISLKTAEKFAQTLGVSVDAVYGREKEKTATNGDGQNDFNDLSEKDKRFIEWFRSLSEEKQKAILISQDAPADLF